MSKFFSLNERDVIKGFCVAVLSAGLTALYNLLQTGTTITKSQLVSVGVAGITAGLGYLIKNVFQNSDGNFSTEQDQITKNL